MAQFQDMMCCSEPMEYHESNEVNYFYCPTCEESIKTDEFDAQSTVKTMSGKPHVPRELIADKDITPKEAMHRKMLRTEMDDNSFREEVTEIAWGNMTDRQPFDDEETIDKLYEYSMKAYAFDEGLSNEDLQIIWKEAEGHGSIRKYINKDYYWVTEQNPHPHEDMIDEGNVTEEMNTAMEEALDEGNMDSWIGHTHYTQDEDGKDIEVEVSGVFNSEDDKYPITRGVFWGGVFGLTLPWVIDQIKNRSNKEE